MCGFMLLFVCEENAYVGFFLCVHSMYAWLCNCVSVCVLATLPGHRGELGRRSCWPDLASGCPVEADASPPW